jgi:hypothetical protein
MHNLPVHHPYCTLTSATANGTSDTAPRRTALSPLLCWWPLCPNCNLTATACRPSPISGTQICCATYLSSEAFSSSTASLKFAPSSCRATASMLVVLPVPGGPCMWSAAVRQPGVTQHCTHCQDCCNTLPMCMSAMCVLTLQAARLVARHVWHCTGDGGDPTGTPGTCVCHCRRRLRNHWPRCMDLRRAEGCQTLRGCLATAASQLLCAGSHSCRKSGPGRLMLVGCRNLRFLSTLAPPPPPQLLFAAQLAHGCFSCPGRCADGACTHSPRG